MRQAIFNLAIEAVGRLLLLRDLAFGWARFNWHIPKGLPGVSRETILSKNRKLDAILLSPSSSPPRAAVLICHGIGETVQRWFKVQQLLATQGVTSLVFDYSGYGRSTGHFDSELAEQDAVAAFHFLSAHTPLPISLLGFSLGSGIAGAIVSRVPANGLLLCAAFTSIRDAARSVGIPGWLGFGVPPIWHTAEALRGVTIPVLVVHGQRDRLFSTTMASELAACRQPPAQLIVVPDLTHNEPFDCPTLAYWKPIADRLSAWAASA